MPTQPPFPRLFLGLIGAGIQASRTPAMHMAEAAAHGISCHYQLIDLDQLGLLPEDLPSLLEFAEFAHFAGLNITHPCKQSILPLLTEISPHASAIGAVNTVLLGPGRRSGHNTDWLGFRQALLHGLPDAPLNHIVQLGAGGAGAATAYALLHLGASHLTIHDTDPARAAALVARYQPLFPASRIAVARDLAHSLASADGLVHATPPGMASHPGLPLPASLLRPSLWVAEIVYFPLETELLRTARALGCPTLDGSLMAIHQAVEAFRLFTGLEPDPARMAATFLSLSPTP